MGGLKLKQKQMIMFLVLILALGCNPKSDDEKAIYPTITANPDSKYEEVFKELAVGNVYDFTLKLPEADKRWVKIWVDHYINGEKQPDPLLQVSYGKSLQKLVEGHLGFGMVNPSEDDASFFLYAPAVKQQPRRMGSRFTFDGVIGGWNYASNEDVRLKIGESKVLGVYRQTKSNSIQTYNVGDPKDREQMFKEDSSNLVLKIKVEEAPDDE